jgi:hypothetical protein
MWLSGTLTTKDINMNKIASAWVQDVFQPAYYEQLNLNPDRKRGDGFLAMFRALAESERSWQILETGCMRPGGELSNDGQSTRLFAEYAEAVQGLLVSVDIDKNHIEHASRNTNVASTRLFCRDSVKFITQFEDEFLEDIYFRPGLIYLDSYDVDFREPWRSNLHHMKELTSLAWAGFLGKGTIIGIDDCLFPSDDNRIASGIDHKMVGKGFFVEEFMNDIDAKKIHDGYQKVWIIR